MLGWIRTHPLSFLVELLAKTMAALLVVLILWGISIDPFVDATTLVAASGALLIVGALSWRLATMTRRAARHKKLSRQVLRRLGTVRQSERNRTARELHDGVCQLLVATRHSLELAAERRASAHEFDLLFSRGMKQLADAILETRRVSHDLKSILLSEHEFTDALSYLGSEFAGRTQVQMNLRTMDRALDSRLTTPAKAALLRITQEALANVQKHSGASQVELALENCSGHVELRIADNGHGFRNRTAGVAMGIGIDNMRERAVALGGSLSLRSTSSHTEVIARLPLTHRRSCGAKAP